MKGAEHSCVYSGEGTAAVALIESTTEGQALGWLQLGAVLFDEYSQVVLAGHAQAGGKNRARRKFAGRRSSSPGITPKP